MLTLSLALGLTATADASPLTGCTFFKERLRNQSWPGGVETGCANFTVKPGGCTKTKVTPIGTFRYPGDLITGRLPSYFVEVTPQLGQSIFALDPDGIALKLQLQAAEAHWTAAVSPLPALAPGAKQGHSTVGPGEVASQFFHARALLVPYGVETWSFLTIGVAAGSIAPICYGALSEYTPQTWSDALAHPDTPFAALFTASSEAVCSLPGTALMGDFDVPVTLPGGGRGFDVDACAIAVAPWAATAGTASPFSEVAKGVLNPARQCMGRLGPLLPRTGYADTTDPHSAAYTAAYRMASLGNDHFHAGPGIEAGDRWQQVWPPAANPAEAACHIPGAERPVEMVPGVPLFAPTVPGSDGAYVRPAGTAGGLVPAVEGLSPYVWAVWRKFEVCGEPLQGAVFSAELGVEYLVKKAACGLVQDGMP